MIEKKRLISILTNDESSILNRITECFLQQGYSIDTLNAGKVDLENNISKINISIKLNDKDLSLVLRKIKKIIPVYDSFEILEDDSIVMELALIKLKMKNLPINLKTILENNENICIIARNGEKINKHILEVSKNFNDNDIVVIRMTETKDYIDRFIDDYKEFIVNISRTGELAIELI